MSCRIPKFDPQLRTVQALSRTVVKIVNLLINGKNAYLDQSLAHIEYSRKLAVTLKYCLICYDLVNLITHFPSVTFSKPVTFMYS